MIITIQIPHILHFEGKLFDSRGCLLLVHRDDFGSSKFTIYEMMKGSSIWSVRYHVDTDDFMTPLPDGWSIWSTVWSIVLGEREDGSFWCLNLFWKRLWKYDTISMKSVGNPGFHSAPLAMLICEPKQVDHKVYEFNPVICKVSVVLLSILQLYGIAWLGILAETDLHCWNRCSWNIEGRYSGISSLCRNITEFSLSSRGICGAEEVHPQLPSPDATMHERPAGKVGLYTRFFDYANYRIPFSTFFVSVLTYFRIPFSQLSVFRSANVSHLKSCAAFNLDSVKNWNDHFFWVDEFVVPANARFSWFLGFNIVKDRAPAPSEYNAEHVNTLIAQASPFLRFLEEFFCRVGISRNYLLNKNTYPRFEYENEEEMDLNAFIRTADPRKVRIAKRARAENESPIVTVAKHHTVTLRLTSVVRSSGELSASVEREFVRDASVGDGRDQGFDSVGGQDNVEPTMPVTEHVEIEIPGPKRSKKKRVTHGSEKMPAASHPPKRLRADYGTTGGSATGASPLEEGGDRTDFVTGPSLRTVGPSARFVVLYDSSHHSGAKSADPEVDSLVRSVAPVMTEATTVATVATTVAIPADEGQAVVLLPGVSMRRRL
ncbi:hypothetical protein Tco_1093474 [Tanacetum coccineum]|uniref:Aminotransferase-like plant mobile domain-containing protein n=1 Tax=Tanacetum coccineum TaxID=301880 RepID=A0ABQ5ICU3_9ASTR